MTQMSNQRDQKEIVAKTRDAIRGDVNAFAVVFQIFRPRLQAHALYLVGNPLAYDLVQDTFLAALTHISTLRDPEVVYPWLKKILVHQCYRALEREKALSAREKYSVGKEISESYIDRVVEEDSNKRQLYMVMSTLSPELRSCVLLRYFTDLNSYADIASILGVPIGTVRSRLASAREKLCAEFSHYHDPSDRALREATERADYFRWVWDNLYDDANVRHNFFASMDPALEVRFTSGLTGTGKGLLQNEIQDDLHFGSRLKLRNVTNSGNLTVLEGENHNSAEYPDRCAPCTTLVFFDGPGAVLHRCNVFDSPRG